jgi:hypothetical protein
LGAEVIVAYKVKFMELEEVQMVVGWPVYSKDNQSKDNQGEL